MIHAPIQVCFTWYLPSCKPCSSTSWNIICLSNWVNALFQIKNFVPISSFLQSKYVFFRPVGMWQKLPLHFLAVLILLPEMCFLIQKYYLYLFLSERQWEAERGRKRVSVVLVTMILTTNTDKAGGILNQIRERDLNGGALALLCVGVVSTCGLILILICCILLRVCVYVCVPNTHLQSGALFWISVLYIQPATQYFRLQYHSK